MVTNCYHKIFEKKLERASSDDESCVRVLLSHHTPTKIRLLQNGKLKQEARKTSHHSVYTIADYVSRVTGASGPDFPKTGDRELARGVRKIQSSSLNLAAGGTQLKEQRNISTYDVESMLSTENMVAKQTWPPKAKFQGGSDPRIV